MTSGGETTPAVLIVHNPRSRRGAERLEELAPILERSAAARAGEGGLRYASLEALDEAEVPTDRVVAIGGDGTVNAALSFLERHDAQRPLGIIPAGTGNNLAMALGLPLDPRLAAKLALEGAARRAIDAVSYEALDARNDAASSPSRRLFVQSGALAFPAEIGARYDRRRRSRVFRAAVRPLGSLVYSVLAVEGIARKRIAEWSRSPGLEARLRFVDENGQPQERTEPVLAIFLGNDATLGGKFVPCPRAEIDDGLVDLCVVRARQRFSYLRVLSRVRRGTHLDLEKAVFYARTPGPLDMELSEPLGLLADGDVWLESAHFRFTVLPRRFEIVVPTAPTG